MKQQTSELLRGYLLQQLDDRLQEETEQRLMTDPELIDELRMAETELIDEYVSGRLQGAEKGKFEELFLRDPERRRQVMFAQSLRRYVSTAPREAGTAERKPQWIRFGTPGLRIAFSAAGLLILLAGSWLVLRVKQLQQDLERVASQQSLSDRERQDLASSLQEERSRGARLEQELEALKSGRAAGQAASAGLVAISLVPGLVRDVGGMQRFEIGQGADRVRLDLALEDGSYASYSARLQTADGQEVWSQSGLRARETRAGRIVSLLLSREALRPQDYVVRLSGRASGGALENAGTYHFRITP